LPHLRQADGPEHSLLHHLEHATQDHAPAYMNSPVRSVSASFGALSNLGHSAQPPYFATPIGCGLAVMVKDLTTVTVHATYSEATPVPIS
jgi:hypothetical protein